MDSIASDSSNQASSLNSTPAPESPFLPVQEEEQIDEGLDSIDLKGRFSPSLRSAPSSPGLFPIEQLTPSTSRDMDDFAISSDSDIGSASSFSLKTPNKPRKKSKSSFLRTRSESESSDTSVKKMRKRKDSVGEKTPKSNRPSRRKEEALPAARIFRNLLILEESLRQQLNHQKYIRRKYIAFLAMLCSSAAMLGHRLYFVVEQPGGLYKAILQLLLLAVLVTLVLFHLSGEYKKNIVLPRRFLSSTNKGLRQMNFRLVKIKMPMGERIIDVTRAWLRFVVNFLLTCLVNLPVLYRSSLGKKLENTLNQLDSTAQPKLGNDVKFVLNPRAFSTNIREGWELYRTEFWSREGARRRNKIENPGAEVLKKSDLLQKDKRERKDRRRMSKDMEGTPDSLRRSSKSPRPHLAPGLTTVQEPK